MEARSQLIRQNSDRFVGQRPPVACEVEEFLRSGGFVGKVDCLLRGSFVHKRDHDSLVRQTVLAAGFGDLFPNEIGNLKAFTTSFDATDSNVR